MNKKMNTCSVCNSTKRVYFNSKANALYCQKHNRQYEKHGKILNRTRFDKNEILAGEYFAEICLYDKQQNVVAKTKIDLDDIEKCRQYKWYLKVSNKNKLYVQQRVGRIQLSHIITGFNKEKGFEIDHINGDTLDNRKENLRIVTHQHNMMNQRVLPSNNTSGTIGVTWDKKKLVG